MSGERAFLAQLEHPQRARQINVAFFNLAVVKFIGRRDTL
jgi:hypothetical protein